MPSWWRSTNETHQILPPRTFAEHRRRDGLIYACKGERDRGQVSCWAVPGEAIDRAVESLLLETVVPEELELCLAVEHEVDRQVTALERQWKVRLEQASYEARHAEHRYKAVDPDNRVVARTLERASVVRSWSARRPTITSRSEMSSRVL